jgi:hypothetical protein
MAANPITENLMKTKLIVFLAALPILASWGLLLATVSNPDLLIISQLGLLAVGIVYATHAALNRELETTHRVLWAIALIIFPFFLSPAYWFQQFFPRLSWNKWANAV